MSSDRVTLKNFIRRRIAHGLSRLPKGLFTDTNFFSIYERRGIHITPTHYYCPVPILHELEESVWSTKSAMVGIDMNLDTQRELIGNLSRNYFSEYYALNADPLPAPGRYSRSAGFGGADGAMLYSMIRSRKPRRIIEVGSGQSTLLATIAARKNLEDGASACHITAIDPYPPEYLRDALVGSGEILQQRVETVPLDAFAMLNEDDILFIDSSHTVKVGGDVVFEINEVLPRLRRGVVVHFHDIAFPLNYSRELVVERQCFWAEQYLLQAFLAFNPKFRILWCFSYVQTECPDILRDNFLGFREGENSMGSLWMETVA